MTRKGENIYHRRDGRWEARYIKGYYQGKALYGYLYASSYTEVKAKKALVLAQPELVHQPSVPQLVHFETLSKLWLNSIHSSVKESTYARYLRIINIYLLPLLGKQRLDKIGTVYLSQIPALLMQQGGKQKQQLAPKTVCDMVSVLKAVLRYGQEQHYPVPDWKSIKYPAKRPRTPVIITSESLKKIEEQTMASEDLVSLGILFTLFTGVRIGELCGLQWGDIDCINGRVQIKRTLIRIPDSNPLAEKKTKLLLAEPKTASSYRLIPLPKFLLSYIIARKKDSFCYLLTGTPKHMEPHQFYMLYKRYLRALGLEGYTFHALRHTFATRCVELGFDAKSLAELLGHANILTTLAVYVHPTLQQKHRLMNLLKPVS